MMRKQCDGWDVFAEDGADVLCQFSVQHIHNVTVTPPITVIPTHNNVFVGLR
jgi:hypothetical protein